MTTETKDIITEFRVVAVSTNANSFGLTAHVLMARDGETWEVARSRGKWNDPQWNVGDTVHVPGYIPGGYNANPCPIHTWARLSVEIPRKLPGKAPAAVIAEVFKK